MARRYSRRYICRRTRWAVSRNAKPRSIEFSAYDNSGLIADNVHESRKTVQGRKRLVQAGGSMKGYRKGNGDYSEIPFTEKKFGAWDGEGGFGILGPSCGIWKDNSVNSTR